MMRVGFTLIELMIVIAIIAIIAAIAIPNLLESRVTANEAAASTSLKSGIFAGQVQFQGGAYQDLDADNVGEYGTLTMLSGLQSTNRIPAGTLKLLTGPLASAGSWQFAAATAGTAPGLGKASGFMFSSFVCSETGGVSGSVTQTLLVDSTGTVPAVVAGGNTATNGTKYWLAICAPAIWGSDGRRIFLISPDGQIRSPALNTVVGPNYGTATGPITNAPYSTGIAASIAGQFCLNTGTTVAAAGTAAVTMMDAGDYYVWGYPTYSK